MNNKNNQNTHLNPNKDLATSIYDNADTIEIKFEDIENDRIGEETLTNIFYGDITEEITEQNPNMIETNNDESHNIIESDETEEEKDFDNVEDNYDDKVNDDSTEEDNNLKDEDEVCDDDTEAKETSEEQNNSNLDDLSILYDNQKNETRSERKKKKESKKLKIWQKALVTLICIGLIFSSALTFLLYGPYPNFREWLITTAMTTMNHQYLATWFYSEKTIDSILKKNYVKETDEDVDTSQVKFVDYSTTNVMYKNKYEKEILTKDEGNDLYKLININESGMRGYLVVIYDPSKVKIATATNMSSSGEMLTDMVKKNNAVIGMNASGFVDPNYNGNGGNPHGFVIKDGKLVSDLAKPNVGGGIIGFTEDNKLILGKMSASEALKKGVRDAIEFGPYLIVNGKPSFIKGNGGWGTAPRSAIAQRQDGIVLFLVMDGRDYAHGIDGVGMVELTEILMQYGAYNASNLDGGTSSGLVIGDKLINKPVNGSGQQKTRKIPDAWIVVK